MERKDLVERNRCFWMMGSRLVLSAEGDSVESV
jgi:hypothetical protein